MHSITHDKFERLVPSVFIKEARQGLSQNLFVIQFAGFHAFLAFTAFSCITATGRGMSTGSPFEHEGAFWFILSLFLLLLAPIAGVNSLSSEVSGNTLELMRMTNLSARRIVYGKWSYQLVFAILMGLSAMPYLLMLRLANSGDMLQGLALVISIVLASCFVSGICIGVSSLGAGRLRPLLIIALCIGGFFGLIGLGGWIARSGTGVLSWDIFLGMIVIGLPSALYMLELGASRIGTEIENGSVALRSLSLLLMVVACLYSFFGTTPEFGLVVSSICVVALPWQPMLAPSIFNGGVLRRFRRFGRLGYGFGRTFLYPGWHTGSNIAILLLGLYLVTLFAGGTSITAKDRIEMAYIFLNLGMLPVFLRVLKECLQMEGEGFPLSRFTLALAGLFVLSIFVGALSLYSEVNLMFLTAVTPVSAFVYSLFGSFKSSLFEVQFGLSIMGMAVTISLAWYKGIEARSQIDELEKRAPSDG